MKGSLSGTLWRLAMLAALASGAAAAPAAKKPSAKDVVTAFYKAYMPWTTKSKTPRPRLACSKSFARLVDENERLCKEKAGTDICGFAANADPYLDAQDADERLTFEKAETTVTEDKVGTVVVKFVLFPSQKGVDRGAQTISFTMIEEDGAWVVDDILYGSRSARAGIDREIGELKKQ